MKQLFIIRHAKAELHSLCKKDFDRDLVDKGINRAQQIAEKLNRHITIDDKTLIISSPANRAKQTAVIFAEILNHPVDLIQYEPSIYEASTKDLVKVVNNIPSHIDKVLLFGHNPSLSDFIYYCSDQNINLKTSACAQLILVDELDFSHLSKGTATLASLLSDE